MALNASGGGFRLTTHIRLRGQKQAAPRNLRIVTPVAGVDEMLWLVIM
jgi:hypothetical protein